MHQRYRNSISEKEKKGEWKLPKLFILSFFKKNFLNLFNVFSFLSLKERIKISRTCSVFYYVNKELLNMEHFSVNDIYFSFVPLFQELQKLKKEFKMEIKSSQFSKPEFSKMDRFRLNDLKFGLLLNIRKKDQRMQKLERFLSSLIKQKQNFVLVELYNSKDSVLPEKDDLPFLLCGEKRFSLNNIACLLQYSYLSNKKTDFEISFLSRDQNTIYPISTTLGSFGTDLIVLKVKITNFKEMKQEGNQIRTLKDNQFLSFQKLQGLLGGKKNDLIILKNEINKIALNPIKSLISRIENTPKERESLFFHVCRFGNRNICMCFRNSNLIHPEDKKTLHKFLVPNGNELIQLSNLEVSLLGEFEQEERKIEVYKNLIQDLSQYKEFVTFLDENGNSGLHKLCMFIRNEKCISWINDSIPNYLFELKNKDMMTPLHFLCKNKICDSPKALITIAKKLISRGCNVNALDKFGKNACFYALMNENFELVDSLISKFGSKGIEISEKLMQKLKEEGVNSSFRKFV